MNFIPHIPHDFDIKVHKITANCVAPLLESLYDKSTKKSTFCGKLRQKKGLPAFFLWRNLPFLFRGLPSQTAQKPLDEMSPLHRCGEQNLQDCAEDGQSQEEQQDVLIRYSASL